MRDEDKTKRKLIEELKEFRQQIKKIRASEAERNGKDRIFEESEKKYRLLVETSTDMIFTVDLKGNFLFINRAFKKSLGYSKEEIKKINGFELVHPDDLAEVRKQFALLLEGKNVDNMEYRYKTKESSYIHILNNASPIFDSQGNVVAAFGVARDISQRKRMEKELRKAHDELELRVKERTSELIKINKKLNLEIEKRKRTEEELRESEEKYRAIFESLQDVYYRTDEEGRVTLISPSVYAHAGYKPEEVIGKPVTDFYLYPVDRDVFLQKLKESGVINDYELKLITKDGSEIDTSVSSKIVFGKDGKPVGVEGILRNITKRKQAEKALKDSEERYRELVEKAGIAILIDDRKGNFKYLNKKFADIFGYSVEEMKKQSIQSIVHPDDVNRVMKFHKKRLQGKKVPSRYEFKAVKKNGSIICLEVSAVELKEKEKIVGTRSYIWDITKSKQAVEALKDSEEKFRTLSEKSPNMIFINEKGKVVYANKRCEKVMGYKREEFYSPDFNFFRMIAPESIELVESKFVSHLKGKEVEPYEYTLITRYGKRVEALITTKLINYEGERAILGIVTDITERKKIEKALRESEEKFRDIFESANDCLIYLNKSGKIIDVNKKALELSGASKEEIVGRHFTEISILTSREIPKLMYSFTKALVGKYSTLNITIKNKKGMKIPLECSSSVLKREGKISGVLIIARDVTERKKAEEALKESEEKYRNIVELAPGGIVTADLKGFITSCNTAFLNQTGYSKEQIIGKHFSKLPTMRIKDIPKFLKIFNSAIRGKVPKPLEASWIHRDGTSRWGEFRINLMKKDRKPIGIQAIVLDITDRKLAEEELKNSEERLKILFKFAPDAYYMSDLKGNFIDGNKAAEEVIGYKKEELIGKSFLKLKLLSPKQIPKAAKLLAKNALGQPTGPDEFILNRKDGNQVPVEIRTFPVKIEGKTLVLGIARDIRLRKQAEKELIEAKDKAEKALKELKRIQSQLVQRERLAALGELSAGVTHEINNPLNIISGYTQMLLMEENLGYGVRENLEIIEKQVGRASRITEQLLQFSKGAKSEIKKVDVNEVLENTLRLLKQRLEQDKIKIVKKIHLKPVFIYADSSQIHQAFLNIILNASHALSKGGTLTVSTNVKDSNAEISFVDTGCGIPKENLDKLFEPFFTTKEKGAGLGLSIVYGIIEAHRGNIKVKSEKGRGTTFTITLPYEEGASK